MKLIVGLGNPGDRYAATRHNAGFWLVERLAAQSRIALRKDAKFEALVGRHEASGAWLMLPQGHMNLSGKPVQMLASFFRIAPADILVAHDELDFPPGTVRMKQGGGIAGHNGLRDISARIGSHEYWRLRIGIGRPGEQAGADYVLHKPTQEERAAIDAAIGNALEILPMVFAGDLQGAMLKLHSQQPVEPAAAPEKPGRAEKPAPAAPSKEPADRARPAAKAAKPQKSAKVAAAEKPEPKTGGLGSFLKKLLPGTDPGKKK